MASTSGKTIEEMLQDVGAPILTMEELLPYLLEEVEKEEAQDDSK